MLTFAIQSLYPELTNIVLAQLNYAVYDSIRFGYTCLQSNIQKGEKNKTNSYCIFRIVKK